MLLCVLVLCVGGIVGSVKATGARVGRRLRSDPIPSTHIQFISMIKHSTSFSTVLPFPYLVHHIAGVVHVLPRRGVAARDERGVDGVEVCRVVYTCV